MIAAHSRQHGYLLHYLDSLQNDMIGEEEPAPDQQRPQKIQRQEANDQRSGLRQRQRNQGHERQCKPVSSEYRRERHSSDVAAIGLRVAE